MKIQKYTALVTGASSGIGEEIAKKLSNQGIKVIGTSTNINGVKKINNYLKNKGFGFILDLKDSNSITKKIKNLYNNNYSIDILIINAAIKIDKLFIKMNNQDWEDTLKVNLNSIFYTVKSVIHSMIKKKQGRIITVGSIVGYLGNVGQTNYSTSKSGLIGFHKSLALEVAHQGITVNVIAPGLIKTKMTQNLNTKQYKKYISQIPVKRFGTVEEIAHAVIFLCSKKSSYITGQTLHINGGMYMT